MDGLQNDASCSQVSEEPQLQPQATASQSEALSRDPSETEENLHSGVDCFPVIKEWKTSGLFSALGFLVSFAVLWMGLVVLFAAVISLYLGDAAKLFTASDFGSLAGVPASIITSILTIIYALVFYRSYFTEKPLMKSSKAISFCNLLFGGIIFGCLWNSNLTRSRSHQRKEMGSSYLVAVAFSAVAICAVGWNMVSYQVPLLNYAIEQNSHPSTSSLSTGGASQGISYGSPFDSASQLTDSASGVSVSLPSGWKDVRPGSDYPDAVKWVLAPTDSNVQAQLVFVTWDVYSSFSEDEKAQMSRDSVNTSLLDEDYVLANAEQGWGRVDSKKAELVDFGGNTYWKVRVDGISGAKQTYSANATPLTDIQYLRYDNGYAYIFTLDILNGTDETISSLANDAEAIVSSAAYR